MPAKRKPTSLVACAGRKKPRDARLFKELRYALAADADRFHMPSAIIGIANPLILEPATRRRRWWRLDVTRTTAIGQSAADQAADNAGRKATSNDLAGVVVMAAMMTIAIAVTIPPRRWRPAMVPAWRRPVAPLRHGRSGRSHCRAGEDGERQCGKNDLLHGCISLHTGHLRCFEPGPCAFLH